MHIEKLCRRALSQRRGGQCVLCSCSCPSPPPSDSNLVLFAPPQGVWGGRERCSVELHHSLLPPNYYFLVFPLHFHQLPHKLAPRLNPPKSFALPFPLLSLEPSCLLSLPPSPVVGSVCSLWDQLVFSLRSRLARTGGARESARHKKGG